MIIVVIEVPSRERWRLILSQTAEYALRAVLYMAQQKGVGAVRVGEMSKALAVPQNYLSKTLHALVRAGVLQSTRGPNGGFRLALPADEVPLALVISAFDRLDERSRCLLGRPECSDANACSAHAHWKRTAEEVRRFFRRTTVADLAGPAPESARGKNPRRKR